jgi:hypothetical protein
VATSPRPPERAEGAQPRERGSYPNYDYLPALHSAV